jgi:hypothetical protein
MPRYFTRCVVKRGPLTFCPHTEHTTKKSGTIGLPQMSDCRVLRVDDEYWCGALVVGFTAAGGGSGGAGGGGGASVDDDDAAAAAVGTFESLPAVAAVALGAKLLVALLVVAAVEDKGGGGGGGGSSTASRSRSRCKSSFVSYTSEYSAKRFSSIFWRLMVVLCLLCFVQDLSNLKSKEDTDVHNHCLDRALPPHRKYLFVLASRSSILLLGSSLQHGDAAVDPSQFAFILVYLRQKQSPNTLRNSPRQHYSASDQLDHPNQTRNRSSAVIAASSPWSSTTRMLSFQPRCSRHYFYGLVFHSRTARAV